MPAFFDRVELLSNRQVPGMLALLRSRSSPTLSEQSSGILNYWRISIHGHVPHNKRSNPALEIPVRATANRFDRDQSTLIESSNQPRSNGFAAILRLLLPAVLD